jgi:hypothetical protein
MTRVGTQGQLVTTPAGPAPEPRWTTVDGPIIRNVPGHDGPGANQAIPAQNYPAEDRRICADAGAALNQRLPILGLSLYECPWIYYVGEYHGRAKEHVILDSNTRIHRNVVLNLDPIAHDAPGGDDYILANIAPLANLAALHDMAEMPDLRARADLAGAVYDR